MTRRALSLGTLSLGLALLCLAAAMPIVASAQTPHEGRIRVIGRGTIESAPDYAIVRVGISNKAATPAATLDQNSAVARKLIEFSKKFGIDEKDIQTDAVNLMPTTRQVRDQNGNFRQEPDGYTANNMIHVKLTDLAQLGAYMRQIIDQGATNVAGIEFGLSTFDQLAGEARTKAVEDAIQQAQGLAQAAKVKLGRIEEIVYPPRMQAQPFNIRAAEVRAVKRTPVPIATGTIGVTAEVEITWTIE
jgi:uncharacterized protein YggE